MRPCSLANHSKYANGMGGDICTRCFDPMMAGDHWNLGRYDGWRVHDSLSRMRPTDYVSLVLASCASTSGRGSRCFCSVIARGARCKVLLGLVVGLVWVFCSLPLHHAFSNDSARDNCAGTDTSLIG